jgi:hypothetical protein
LNEFVGSSKIFYEFLVKKFINFAFLYCKPKTLANGKKIKVFKGLQNPNMFLFDVLIRGSGFGDVNGILENQSSLKSLN